MLVVALLALAIAGGSALHAAAEPRAGRGERLFAGAAIGLTLLPLAGYGLARIHGFGAAALAGAASLLALAALLGGREPWRGNGTAPSRADLMLFAGGAAVMLAAFDRALLEGGGAIGTGVEHNLGDLPFHLSVITSFAYGGNLRPEHPELSGARLTYPFLVDFGAAQLVAAGASLRQAILAQNAALSLSVLGLLAVFTRTLTGSALASRIGPALVLLSGGLGFLSFLADSASAGDPLGLLGALGRDYTITRDGELRWGNFVNVLLIPQRSLMLGVPLLLIVLTLAYRAHDDTDEGRARRRLLGAGIFAGLMPLAHAHAFASVLAFVGALVPLVPRGRRLLVLLAPAVLIGVPQALWLVHGGSLGLGRFLAFEPGWDSGGRNTLVFWLINAGLFLPLAAFAHARFRGHPAGRFLLPAWGFFLGPNLLRLSPWIWDNIKLLVVWLLATAPLVALWLARRIEMGGRGRAAAALVVGVLCASGALDVFRVASGQISLRIFDADAVAVGKLLGQSTPPDALVLHAARYDSPVLLSGRRSLLGYPGHIWSQGLDQGTREQDIARIYEGAEDAHALLRRYGVTFILLGPSERRALAVNDAFLGRFETVLEGRGYVLKRVASGSVREGGRREE